MTELQGKTISERSIIFSDKAIEFAKELTGIKDPNEACEAFSVACFMFYLDPQKIVDMIP